MERRRLLSAGAALPMAAVLPVFAQAATARTFIPSPGDWRSFEVVHRVELRNPGSGARVWVPIPTVEDGYQRNLITTWTLSSGTAERVIDASCGGRLMAVVIDGKDPQPVVEVTTRLQTQSRSVDLSRPGSATISAADAHKWTAPTQWMPTDGIVLQKALEATKGRSTELDKVRATYDPRNRS